MIIQHAIQSALPTYSNSDSHLDDNSDMTPQPTKSKANHVPKALNNISHAVSKGWSKVGECHTMDLHKQFDEWVCICTREQSITILTSTYSTMTLLQTSMSRLRASLSASHLDIPLIAPKICVPDLSSSSGSLKTASHLGSMRPNQHLCYGFITNAQGTVTMLQMQM